MSEEIVVSENTNLTPSQKFIASAIDETEESINALGDNNKDIVSSRNMIEFTLYHKLNNLKEYLSLIVSSANLSEAYCKVKMSGIEEKKEREKLDKVEEEALGRLQKVFEKS